MIEGKFTLVIPYVSKEKLSHVKASLYLESAEVDTSTLTWYCYSVLGTESDIQKAHVFLKSNPELADNSWVLGCRKPGESISDIELKEVTSKIASELGISARIGLID